MPSLASFWSTIGLVAAAVAQSQGNSTTYSLSVAETDPYTLQLYRGNSSVVEKIQILTGEPNPGQYTAFPVSASNTGDIANNGGYIDATFVTESVVKIQVSAEEAGYVGARLSAASEEASYGVWSYPWNGSLTNRNISFEVKGIQSITGTNYCNARAPFYLSDAGYGVYVDTLAMGNFDFGQPDQSSFIFNSSSISVYLILPEAPNDYKSILKQYGSLSSTVFMPPDSAFGPIVWSDDWNKDFHGRVTTVEGNYYDVVDHLYSNKIRASAVIADRPYGTGNGSWGNFDFNLTAYPDAAALIANLSDLGYDFQVWAANRATPDTLLWNISLAEGWQFDVDQTQLKGGLWGPALNLSIPEAYSWFAEQMKFFPAQGVRGYKVDRGEENEMPVWEQNIQQDLYLKLAYDDMLSSWDEGEFFNFARSANDRSRSHTAVWAGDSHANFTGLSYTLTAGIRSGLIGFAFWGSDTGGYTRKAAEQVPPADKQPPTEEVWARWMHLSAFSPMYELLLGTGATPWYDYTEDLVAVFAETAALHHELLPYIRSYTYAAHATGLPVMRALFIEEPADAGAWSDAAADSEYFFGSELLVAPIVTAGGAREVYFPGGSDVQYLEYTNKTAVHRGGETVQLQLGLHDVPVYVRAGAIIPRGDVVRANDRWTTNWTPWLNVEVFPSWNVQRSVFSYFNKEDDAEVGIVVVTNKEAGEVTITYGAVGHSGNVTVYTKSGPIKVDLLADGGEAIVKDVESLFD